MRSLVLCLLFCILSYRCCTSLHVPLMSVSMNSDNNNYTIRLIKSIDYPVGHMVIQVGNSDINIVNRIVNIINEEGVNKFIKKISISTLPFNPGSAKGFNFGLRHLYSYDRSWILVLNNDIAFYPNVLQRIAEGVELAFDDPKFGVGFTSLCCGGEWSAVVFTHRLVNAIGYFDENFYPAYYEDDDYATRIHYSGWRAVRFNNTPLMHAEYDGSKAYTSNIQIQLYLKPQNSSEINQWRKSHEHGRGKSVIYLGKKWGENLRHPKDRPKVNCKTVEAINDYCTTPFKLPFNESTANLSTWVLSKEVQDRINRGSRHGL